MCLCRVCVRTCVRACVYACVYDLSLISEIRNIKDSLLDLFILIIINTVCPHSSAMHDLIENTAHFTQVKNRDKY